MKTSVTSCESEDLTSSYFNIRLVIRECDSTALQAAQHALIQCRPASARISANL